MEKRQQEIYDDIIRRRGPQNPLTKSQKKHLKRVAKKKAKSEMRREKQLAAQAASGKLISENHNDRDYSPEFTEKAAIWLLEDLEKVLRRPAGFLGFFQSRRPKYQDLVLRWSPGIPRDVRYEFFKGFLELYWDDKTNEGGLLEYAKSFMDSFPRTGSET